MKSLLKENLILNLHTKIIVKKYALKNSKLYFDQYSKAKNTLIIIDEFLISNKKNLLPLNLKSLLDTPLQPVI